MCVARQGMRMNNEWARHSIEINGWQTFIVFRAWEKQKCPIYCIDKSSKKKCIFFLPKTMNVEWWTMAAKHAVPTRPFGLFNSIGKFFHLSHWFKFYIALCGMFLGISFLSLSHWFSIVFREKRIILIHLKFLVCTEQPSFHMHFKFLSILNQAPTVRVSI